MKKLITFLTLVIITFLTIALLYSRKEQSSEKPAAIDTGSKLSRFLVAEDMDHNQHVLAGIWSLPMEYLEYRLEDEKTEKFGIRIKTKPEPCIVHVTLYKRDSSGKDFPAIFHAKLALTKVGKEPDSAAWVEINVFGMLTGWGDSELGTLFAWDAPYSDESFRKANKSRAAIEEVRTIHENNTTHANNILTNLRVYYYSIVLPPYDGTIRIQYCYSRTGKLVYTYQKASDEVIYLTEYVHVSRGFGREQVMKNPIRVLSRKHFSAPWRKE
jgi:hypothetical protein